ncbi:glycine--tRNA ligase subunit beta [Porphyrobacter sp. AAP82]|uniref:glycine--tRNA ligase subunit beta n=1 Tax=Porphyrobacter sp. AAP82 TaxID=1248917 RepID=UPI0004781177|nr:glycine--tRNA ligase subunit beta [Porphyrobacter sp. AAP82]
MADFLLELRCEEIPARMQAGARAELEKLFRREMGKWNAQVGDVTVWSTPRRLVLIARDLPDTSNPVIEETKGPKVSAPEQALTGFLSKVKVTREELLERDGVWFAVKNVPGFRMLEVLHNVVFSIVWDFAWPKSMRWGEQSRMMNSLRWVRPLSGIVAMLGKETVPADFDGLESGNTTYGHRFHASGPVTIDGADDYIAKLRNAFVIVNHEERQDIIREGAAKVAAEAGLTLIADEGLVIENAGLTENPVPLLGRFDEAFLDVPPEVIQLTARVNQKYFVCEDAKGKLANAFVCTANIAPLDPAVVIDGNRKVLAARLSDARFFWEQDQKTPLAVHDEKLSRITFHEKLGTVADKALRVAKLARWLCEEGIVADTPLPLAGGAGGGPASARPDAPTPDPSRKREGSLADLAEQAARLCKADLVTEMVGEFPELQGLMGGYYAAKEGLPQEVAEAIRDHYKPVGQGDDVPTAPVTVAVSLADKLDTLVSFFAVDEKPTGSKDPFALRRQTLAIIALVLKNGLRFRLGTAIGRHDFLVTLDAPTSGTAALDALFDFFADRLKVQQREAGVRHDLIDAVFALGGEDDLVRLLARVHALQAFVTTEDGTNLLAGYKRAANILKKEGYQGPTGAPDPMVLASLKDGNDTIPDTGEEDPLAMVDDPDVGEILAAEARDNSALSYTPEEAEKALIDALDAAAPRAAAAVEAERFADAMAALATLRAPIDRFFEEVTVNDPQADKRAARLALLARFRDAVHRVADFSRIEG